MTIHASTRDGLRTDDDGFIWAACECGQQLGPFPDEETCVDALMSHAYSEGERAGIETYTGTGEGREL
jgi:hypothetical protein